MMGTNSHRHGAGHPDARETCDDVGPTSSPLRDVTTRRPARRRVLRHPRRNRDARHPGVSPALAWSALAIGLLGSSGCSDADLGGECGALGYGTVRLAIWWEDGDEPQSAEGRAFKGLEEDFETCNPDAELSTDSYDEKQELIEAVFHSLPPSSASADDPETLTSTDPTALDTSTSDSALVAPPLDAIQLNAGSDVRQFTPCGTPQETQLRPIEGLPDGELLLRPFRPEVMATVSCDGQTFALPVGIHRLNTLYYNRRLLSSIGCSDEAGLHNQTFQLLVEDVHRAFNGGELSGRTCVQNHATAPAPPSVIAVASRDGWTLSTFLFENLMIAVDGPAGRGEFWSGRNPSGPALTATLQLFVELKPYFSAPLTEPEAFAAVVDAEAVFTVSGDWHDVDLAGSDVALTVFPGTEDSYVFTADVFAVPANSENPAGASAWLRAITSRDVQERYQAEKGGASARVDVRTGLNAAHLLPGLPVLIPDHTFEELDRRLGSWVNQPEPEPTEIIQYIQGEYCKLPEAACERAAAGSPPPDPLEAK